MYSRLSGGLEMKGMAGKKDFIIEYMVSYLAHSVVVSVTKQKINCEITWYFMCCYYSEMTVMTKF
jgi:hypothetical protein